MEEARQHSAIGMAVEKSSLHVVRFAPIEPDVIVSEIWLGEERLMAELIWDYAGTKKLCLSEGEGAEIDPGAFALILSEEMAHLDEWSAALRIPGGAWDSNDKFYKPAQQP